MGHESAITKPAHQTFVQTVETLGGLIRYLATLPLTEKRRLQGMTGTGRGACEAAPLVAARRHCEWECALHCDRNASEVLLRRLRPEAGTEALNRGVKLEAVKYCKSEVRSRRSRGQDMESRCVAPRRRTLIPFNSRVLPTLFSCSDRIAQAPAVGAEQVTRQGVGAGVPGVKLLPAGRGLDGCAGADSSTCFGTE